MQYCEPVNQTTFAACVGQHLVSGAVGGVGFAVSCFTNQGLESGGQSVRSGFGSSAGFAMIALLFCMSRWI